jgi:hypothetical protein
VGVVFPVEGDPEVFEVNPISFFSVPFGFLDLTDHPIVHDCSFLQCEWTVRNKKARGHSARAYVRQVT